MPKLKIYPGNFHAKYAVTELRVDVFVLDILSELTC